ncbi:hypothetical protein CONPUDRAFT_142657 [Coniophora puteana RWD-64-598 SS2]|uniref:Methyltransferase domain-containing protein n=1 Tax=Coniophora puteana (strain RWD-64-598) TaxID=741705 RepID=A0A5M3MZA8_CONPW|nr:uncharacterized protein CONPUDRAFT_142657 [Coniophora puteana RWD-64-598 SS2]EIW84327.1 hypothetical protein CONPUDRAFT_142657 [Coniophora puteana RWD-64-598 SS2]
MSAVSTLVERDVEAELRVAHNKKHRRRERPAGQVVAPLRYTKDMISNDVWDQMLMTNNWRTLTLHKFDGPPNSILDIGCGRGQWAICAAKMWQGSNVVAFDVNDPTPNKRLARFGAGKNDNLPKRLKWVQGDLLEPLPFSDGKFDLVRLSRMGLHIPHDEWNDVLEEIARVLTPGGVLEVIEEDLIFPNHSAPAFTSPPVQSSGGPSIPRMPSSMGDVNRLTGTSPRPSLHRMQSTGDVGRRPSSPRPSIHRMQSTSAVNRLSGSSYGSVASNISHSPYSHNERTSTFRPSHSESGNLDVCFPQASSLSLPSNHAAHSTEDLRDHARLAMAWATMLRDNYLEPNVLDHLPGRLASVFSSVSGTPPYQVFLPPNSIKAPPVPPMPPLADDHSAPSSARSSAGSSELNPAMYSHMLSLLNRQPSLMSLASSNSHSRASTLSSETVSPHDADGEEFDLESPLKQGGSVEDAAAAAAHLRRTMQMVGACRERLFGAYERLFKHGDVPPPIAQPQYQYNKGGAGSKYWRNLRGEDKFTTYEDFRILGSDLREMFDNDWANWENDMVDRAGIRGHMHQQFDWGEPWAVSVPRFEPPLQSVLWRDKLPDHLPDGHPQYFRNIRGFVCFKGMDLAPAPAVMPDW